MEVKVTKKFASLATVYCGMLLISNILANKLIIIGDLVQPCAIIMFPLVYIISDTLTEIYGIKLSKIAITTNTLMNLFMSAILILAVKLPSPPFADATAFNSVLGSTPRVVFASLISYYCGDLVNSYSLSFFKAKLKAPFFNTFLFRSICSSILGQIFATAGFITIAFYGTVPNDVLIQMIALQYSIKIGYQIIAHPITHNIVKWYKKADGIDVVDKW